MPSTGSSIGEIGQGTVGITTPPPNAKKWELGRAQKRKEIATQEEKEKDNSTQGDKAKEKSAPPPKSRKSQQSQPPSLVTPIPEPLKLDDKPSGRHPSAVTSDALKLPEPPPHHTTPPPPPRYSVAEVGPAKLTSRR